MRVSLFHSFLRVFYKLNLRCQSFFNHIVIFFDEFDYPVVVFRVAVTDAPALQYFEC